MQLLWRSCQGSERTSNNDAVAIARQGEWLLCHLVDAAARSDQSKIFAGHWASHIIGSLLQHPVNADQQAVLSIFAQEQRVLRQHFLGEIASYCLLRLNMRTRVAQVFHLGDCRVGLHQAEAIEWQTTPHTLDQQVQEGSRHVLTRSLNARSFVAPDIVEFEVPASRALLMATDGYWAESLKEGQTFTQTRDDASCLTLTTGEWAFTCQSDEDNAFVITK